MTMLTVNIQNERDLPVLQEILDRFGLTYAVEAKKDYTFSNAEISSLLKTKQDYVDGYATCTALGKSVTKQKNI